MEDQKEAKAPSCSIDKFKVKDSLPTVAYSNTNNGIYANYEVSFSNIIHPDLAALLDRLTVHLCLMTELVSEREFIGLGHLAMALNGNEIYEHLAFSSFRCTGFSLSSEGAVLMGRKTLASKKVVNLVSPFVLLNEDSDYPYAGHLNSELDTISAEVKLMLDGKFGGKQLDLFDEKAA